MTVGFETTGGGSSNPYETGTRKIWDGDDDPSQKKTWNRYSSDRLSRSVGQSSYPYVMGISGYLHSLTWTDDDQLRLLDKLSEEAKRHEFNAAVFLGQANEVRSSVVGTATAFIGIKKSLQRGDLGGAMRFLARSVGGADLRAAKKKLDTRDIAGAHLSLVYGWLPLLSDVHAACEAMEVLTNPPRRSSFMVVRGITNEVEGSLSPSLYTCPMDQRRSKRILFEFEEELSAARSLGLLDPASVAWELMPYSFVVDWFVPIGTYLSNLAIVPNLKGYFKVTERAVSSGRCFSNDPRYTSSASLKQTILTRSPVASALSVPLPKFRGLSQLYDNAARTKNAIALLRNLYR